MRPRQSATSSPARPARYTLRAQRTGVVMKRWIAAGLVQPGSDFPEQAHAPAARLPAAAEAQPKARLSGKHVP